MAKTIPFIKSSVIKERIEEPPVNIRMLEWILNGMEEALMLLDDKLNIVYYNKQFQRCHLDFFGIKIKKGDCILSYSLPDQYEVKSICERVLVGATEEREFILKNSDGEEHYYRSLYKPARDENNRIFGVLVSFNEPLEGTRQKLLQEERYLATSINTYFGNKIDLKACLEQLLTDWCSHFDQRAGELWMTDTDEKNARLAASYSEVEPLKNSVSNMIFNIGEGIPGKTLISGQPVFIKDIQNDKAYIYKQFAEVNGLTSATALPVAYKNKTTAVLLFYKKPEQSEHPIIINKAILAQLADAIERKRSEDNLVKLFEYAPELLCIAGPDGHFKKVNPAFAHLLGYSEEQLVTQPFTNFVHPDDLINTKARLRDISAGRVVFSFENRYQTNSNEWKWISWSTSEILNDEGLVFCYGKDITEEKKLRDLLDKTTELAKIGSWEVDATRGRTYWSPVTRKIYDVDNDIAPDRDLEVFFYKEGESRETFKRLIKDGLDHSIKWDVELQIITAKGNDRWVRVIGESEFHAGKCVRLYGSIQDIHARKSAELETQRVLEEKNEILESIGDGFFTVDTNWVVTYWNKQAERMSKKTKDQIVGRNLWQAYPDVINTLFFDHLTRALAHNEMQYFETYLEHNNTWLEVSVYPNDNGLSVYFKNVTERVLADEKLRQSNKLFELVAKATNDAIWNFDLQTGIFNHVGDSFLKLFGYHNQELNSDVNFLANLVHPDDLQSLVESRNECISDVTRMYWEDEYRFKRKDGEFAYVHDRGYIIRDEQGKALRMIGATQDITDRKMYERSLVKLNADLEKYSKNLAASNADLEQFAYVASHDLQEPLRMVSSFMTLLEKNYNDKIDDKGKQYIHFAVDGAKRMKQIIMDLLEFSRVGHFNHQKENVNLKDVLDEILLLNTKLINDKYAAVQIDDLPEVVSHRTPLRQIFQNLIGNALKYSKPDVAPKIKVACIAVTDEYRFEISDNGIGIAAENYNKVFILFQRLYTSGEYPGTGIGLSVCKKIVENLGGRIWVESEEGKGSSFYFTLPRQQLK